MSVDLPSGSGLSRAARLLALGLIVLIGGHLRFGAAASTVVDSPVRADAAQYVAYAFNLRLHEIYSRQFDSLLNPAIEPKPDALRTPGYPLFLYPFTWTNDLERFAKDVVFMQAGLSTITIVIAYAIAVPVLGPWLALGVGLLTALSPHLVTANTYLLTETVFAFLLALSILLIQRAAGARNRSFWVLAGLALGAAALVRPTLQYFVVLVAVLAAWPKKGQSVVRSVLPLMGGFLAVFGVWVIRNWLELGVSGDSTLAISTLHHGMYPGFMFAGQPESFGFPYRFDPDARKIGASLGAVLSAIVERFQASFLEHAAWYAIKPVWLFEWGIIAGQGDVFIYPTLASPYYDQALFVWTRELMFWVHAVLVWLAFAGTAIAWVPRISLKLNRIPLFALRIVSGAYLYFIAVHVIGAPFPRYSIPIRPLTYILALVPISLLLAWSRAKIAGRRRVHQDGSATVLQGGGQP